MSQYEHAQNCRVVCGFVFPNLLFSLRRHFFGRGGFCEGAGGKRQLLVCIEVRSAVSGEKEFTVELFSLLLSELALPDKER